MIKYCNAFRSPCTILKVSPLQSTQNGTKSTQSKKNGAGTQPNSQVSNQVVPGPQSASHVVIDDKKKKKCTCCVIQQANSENLDRIFFIKSIKSMQGENSIEGTRSIVLGVVLYTCKCIHETKIWEISRKNILLHAVQIRVHSILLTLPSHPIHSSRFIIVALFVYVYCLAGDCALYSVHNQHQPNPLSSCIDFFGFFHISLFLISIISVRKH